MKTEEKTLLTLSAPCLRALCAPEGPNGVTIPRKSAHRSSGRASIPFIHSHIMQMFSDRVHGTTVSFSELKKKIRAALSTRSNFGPAFRMERIGENQGFLSITVRIYFDWVGDDAQLLPDTLVLKIPSTAAMIRNIQAGSEEVIREQHARLAMILDVGHVSEVSFYAMASREGLFTTLKIPPCIRAQHFRRKGSESGYLLLGDVRHSIIRPLWAGLREAQVKAILEQLAKLHAFSLTNEMWRNGAGKIFRSTFLEVQKAYPEITRARIGKAIAQLNRDFGVWFMRANGRNLLSALAEVVDDQLLNFNGDLVHANSGMPPVLVHGDLWTNNVMWDLTEHGVDSDNLVAIIDWQNVHAGNVAEDLVRLLGSSCSPRLRRGGLHRFVSHYLSCLSLELRRKGHFSLPFTHQQIVNAYERMFGQGLLIMLPSLNACADEGNGLLGGGPEENRLERQALVLERTRALIEDFLAFRAKHLLTFP
ncbi:unnamed protein product, partial [Mesorhabditis belari]|uniref:CHK kinase-like domain-containing protein n=1 Tax=Mesorhabditis belari TaxID=2138241 RepID=A0AAF3FBK5_9BILA